MNLTFLYRGILILSMGRLHRILIGLTWLNRPIYCYSSSDPGLFVLTLACSYLKNAHPFLVVQGLISRSACTKRLVSEFLCSAFRPAVQPVTPRIVPHNSSITGNINSWLEVSRIIAHFSYFKGKRYSDDQPLVFWDATQRWLVHIDVSGHPMKGQSWPLQMGPLDCSETSVSKY
jgi:hypothetical protein